MILLVSRRRGCWMFTLSRRRRRLPLTSLSTKTLACSWRPRNPNHVLTSLTSHFEASGLSPPTACIFTIIGNRYATHQDPFTHSSRYEWMYLHILAIRVKCRRKHRHKDSQLPCCWLRRNQRCRCSHSFQNWEKKKSTGSKRRRPFDSVTFQSHGSRLFLPCGKYTDRLKEK